MCSTYNALAPIPPKGLFQKEYDYVDVPQCFKDLHLVELISTADHILDQTGVNISDIKSKLIAVLLEKLLDPIAISYTVPQYKENVYSLMRIFCWLLEHHLYSNQLEVVFDEIVREKNLDTSKENEINAALLLETDHVYPNLSREEMIECFYTIRNRVYETERIIIDDQSPLINVIVTDPLASALQVDESKFHEMIEKERKKCNESRPRRTSNPRFRTLFNIQCCKEMILRHLDLEDDDSLPIIDHYMEEMKALKDLKRSNDY